MADGIAFSPAPVRKKNRLQGVVSNLRCFYIDHGDCVILKIKFKVIILELVADFKNEV